MRKVMLFLILIIFCVFLTAADEKKASIYLCDYDVYIINSVDELYEIESTLVEKQYQEDFNYYKEKYQEDYFEEKSLILVLLDNGVPDVDYAIENIEHGEDYLKFDIINYFPEMICCVVLEILLEIELDYKIPSDYDLRINESVKD